MGPRKCLLVVEDCAVTRAALTRLLQRAGYDVAGAANGQEALDQLGPAAILLDLDMPALSGWEFCWRRDPRLKRIPVLLLSGEDGLAETAATLNVAGYFPKPVDDEELLDALHNLSKAAV